MTALTICADELIMAFEDHNPTARHFFDRQTGEVVSIFEDTMDEEDTDPPDAEPDRYLLIEPVPSSVGYEVMGEFVETLPEGKARDELVRALQQSKPFRRFKDVLLNYPALREDWFRFHEQAFIDIIKEWLKDHGVEVTIVPFHAQP